MPATHTADFQKHSRLTEVPVPEKAQHVASAGQNTSTRLQLIKLQAGHMALQLLLILGLFFIKAANTDSKIRCFVPSVMRGEQTNITCSFGDKIEIDDFVIQQYPQRGGFKEITFCYRDSGKLECQISESASYQKHELHNGIFTLTVLNATEDDTGRYMCQVIPSVPENTESCYFTLKEPTHTTPGVTAAGGAETTTQSNASQTHQTTSTENDEEDTVQLTLIAVLVGVLVVVLLISVGVVVWHLCRKGREKGGCVERASFSNRDSGNVSTLDIETNSRQREQTEEDREHTQPLISRNEDIETGKSHENSDKTQSNNAVSQNTSPQAHASQSSSSPAKPVKQSPSDASRGSEIQNQEPRSGSGVKATNSAEDVISQTNATSITSPSHRSAERARSADSAAWGSSQVYSEQNAKHQAYAQALKALQDTGAVIIAGPEKCGKTTLGRELLDHFTEEGYTPHTKFTDPTMWSSYVRDPDKKCAFLFDERFKAGDKAVSQNTWTHCLRNLRDRHYPLVIIVQTSERKEEDVRPFSFLRTIPVVFAVGEKKKDSASKTMTEKEDQPRREVWHTTVDPSGKVGRTARENTEEHQLDLVIFMLNEQTGRGPEADEYDVKRLLKTIGVSDNELREVTCVTRLGEKKDRPPRPVIITVKTLETKQKIIDSAWKITPKVHIHPYTTESEIEKQRALFGRLG